MPHVLAGNQLEGSHQVQKIHTALHKTLDRNWNVNVLIGVLYDAEYDSQELLEAVERERSITVNRSRNATIFRHLTLGDFELQRVGVST